MQNKSSGVMPPAWKKDTVDYAKNIVFVIGLQAIATKLVNPHGGYSAEWWKTMYAIFVAIATGALSALATTHFLECMKVTDRRLFLLASALAIICVFAAGQVTKTHLLDG